ncbi:hypothetical protein SYNPS1DRAFT_27369 [Syncephalis pseudoplumigaleata]|uniref:Uncharacterized protein n=1 Tax=Syncephalis pseudoplumigaleata TaxID=1712513 RepID=A0A4P9Z3G3_9FUNG|nr:hypothetical protein SYNPS1DRAFT_27369 [Syncephalis pseudoplumigaleata]|eukprot:RKP26955.1 hypothetical protein SYNPS1DRAFT_27369 [Syncephalis pseudoplumigaleata]
MTKKICSRVIARFNSNRKRSMKLCIRNKHESLRLLAAEFSHGRTHCSSSQLADWTRKLQENGETSASWMTIGWGLPGLLQLWIVRQHPPGTVDRSSESSLSSEHACDGLRCTTSNLSDDGDAGGKDDGEEAQAGMLWPAGTNQLPLDWDTADDYCESSPLTDNSDCFRPSLTSARSRRPSNADFASAPRAPPSSFPTVASFELRWRLRYNPARADRKPWQRAFPDVFDVRLDEENLLTYSAERIDQWRGSKPAHATACTVLHLSEACVHVRITTPRAKHGATIVEVTLHSRSDKNRLVSQW